jgi:hypothetical protein
MDVLSIVLYGTGFVWFYWIICGIAVVGGLFIIGLTSLLYLLKFFPGGFLGFIPLFTIVLILHHAIARGKNSLGDTSPSGEATVSVGNVGGVADQSGTSSRKDSSSYRYGFGRAIGETHARGISGFLAWFFRKLPIAALIGLIIFGFFYYTNADLRASLQERVSHSMEKLNLDKTFAPLIKYLNPDYIAKSAAGIGDFQTRPDYVTQEMQGVIVDRFDGEDGYVGAPLFFEGELTVDSFPKEDVTLVFECLLRDKDVTVRQGIVNIGGEPEGTSTLFLPQGKKDQKVFVTCQFDPIEDIAGAFKDYRAVLIWKYQDISTKTILRAYTQERATQVSLKSKGIDPLESIRDTTYVDEEGYAIPLCVQHCGLVDLSVALQSPLPLAEDGVHYLTIKLFSQTAWSGTIQRMNALTLVLPDGLTFGDQGCFFVGKKEKLSVDDHKLHLTEQDPSVVSFNEHLIAKKPDDFEFKCDIDVHATTDEQPSPQTIQSVAMYDYGGEETTLFKVYGVEA